MRASRTPGMPGKRSLAMAVALVLALLCSTLLTTTPASGDPEQKTYDDFLQAILTFESDIDPAQSDIYCAFYQIPEKGNDYQQVHLPGVPIRQTITGAVEVDKDLTYLNVFTRLGIELIYQRCVSDPAMFLKMQTAVVNFLGFIGYQFSEQDLHDLGYYDYALYRGKASYYSDVPDSTWAGDVHYAYQPDQDVYFTDYNRWEGTFTGKHGITDLRTFKEPQLAKFVALDHFVNKYNGIVSGLAARGKTLDDYLGSTIKWSQLDPAVTPPPGGRADEVTVTMSGLLAGAHLRGAEGVVSMLLDHKNPADEIGTHILQYVQDFGGYETPFKPNSSRIPVTIGVVNDVDGEVDQDWRLLDDSGDVVYSDSSAAGAYNVTLDLDPDECYTIRIGDSAGDGWSNGGGYLTVLDEDGASVLGDAGTAPWSTLDSTFCV